jgi:REP element-mobilizing transposase RayT
MTLPREVIPGRFYMVTRRCTQRQLLLRPDEETNNAFLYCLAEAAQRFGVEILLTCAMSNHYLCPAAHKWCYGERLVMWS